MQREQENKERWTMNCN